MPHPAMSDELIEAILLAPQGERHADIAKRLGVRASAVQRVRLRGSWVAIRAAQRLGLPNRYPRHQPGL
jgi:hypothetical protein